MMKLWQRRDMTAIGLDVGAAAIKAAQLRGRPGAWEVTAVSLVPRPDLSADLSCRELALLPQTLARQGFVGRTVVAALPARYIVGGIVELAAAGASVPTEHAAREQLAAMHRLDPEALEVEWWELPAGRRGREGGRLMATGCATVDAGAFLDLLEGAGLDVIALDSSATALGRLWQQGGHSDQPLTAMIDLGWSAALLVLLCRGVVIYERRLPEIGLGRLYRTLIDVMEIEPAIADYLIREVGLGDVKADVIDAGVQEKLRTAIRDHHQDLSRELSVSLSYASHQYPDGGVSGLVLTGGGAGVRGLEAWLQSQLPVPITPLRLGGSLDASKLGGSALASPASLAVALGLTLHEEARR